MAQPQKKNKVVSLEETSSGSRGFARLFSEQSTLEHDQAHEDSFEEPVGEAGDREPGFEIPLSHISVGKFTIREHINERELEGLVESIRIKGVIQPIVVRPREGHRTDGDYELVLGERRYHASLQAGLKTIPAIVRELGDRDSLEMAIVENVEREDLNPIEEALAYRRLIKDCGVNQTDISKLIGKNRATVSNTLRLLDLPEEIIEYLKSGELSEGHGRALLRLHDEKACVRLARRVVSSGASVRALEEIVKRAAEPRPEPDDGELELQEELGRLSSRVEKYLDVDAKVKLDSQEQKRLTLVFPTDASWKRFMRKIRE